MPQEFKKYPSTEKKISEIKDSDIRIRVIGTVLEVQDQSIILDDGTGKLKATFEMPINTSPQKLVRIIGRVMPAEGNLPISGDIAQHGIEIRGEVLQNMDKLDLDVFKKLQSIK